MLQSVHLSETSPLSKGREFQFQVRQPRKGLVQHLQGTIMEVPDKHRIRGGSYKSKIWDNCVSHCVFLISWYPCQLRRKSSLYNLWSRIIACLCLFSLSIRQPCLKGFANVCIGYCSSFLLLWSFLSKILIIF